MAHVLAALVHLGACATPLATECAFDAPAARTADTHTPPRNDVAPSFATRTEAARPSVERASHPTRVDDAALLALQRGLDWLAARADESATGTQSPLGLDARGGLGFAAVAIDALAALAWMGDGTTLERGPHGRALARTVDALLARVEMDAEAAAPGYVSLAGDGLSRMHGHGYATLALSQAWTCSPSSERGARIQRALPLAVRCIERSQGLEGGWWYEPRKSLEHEGSITITLAQALRSANQSGVRVDPATIARAIEYVQRSQKDDGSFRYALADPSSSIALTAAAIGTLDATGTYTGKIVDEGYDWLARALAVRATSRLEAPNPFDPDTEPRAGRRVYCRHYERLYVAQCLWQHADATAWNAWAQTETARVLTEQRADGSWSDTQFGDAYATAMCCLFLEVPLGVLPAFQR